MTFAIPYSAFDAMLAERARPARYDRWRHSPLVIGYRPLDLTPVEARLDAEAMLPSDFGAGLGK